MVSESLRPNEKNEFTFWLVFGLSYDSRDSLSGRLIQNVKWPNVCTVCTDTRRATLWRYLRLASRCLRHCVTMLTVWLSRQHLENLYDLVTVVNVFDSHDAENLDLLSRPDLGVTFTKLHCWRLTQFSKCIFMDADTLVSEITRL